MTIARKLLLAAVVVVTSTFVHADLVQLVLNVPSGPPGTTLSFSGTLTNLTSSTIYLVTPNLLQTGGLTPDYSAFNSLSPLALAPNATTGPLLLFTAVIDPATPVGTQIDAQFSLTGGTDPTSTGIAAQQFFVVNVAAPTSTPEPAMATLLLFGLAVVLAGAEAGKVGVSSRGAGGAVL